MERTQDKLLWGAMPGKLIYYLRTIGYGADSVNSSGKEEIDSIQDIINDLQEQERIFGKCLVSKQC